MYALVYVQVSFKVMPPAAGSECKVTLGVFGEDAKFSRSEPVTSPKEKSCALGLLSKCRMCPYENIMVSLPSSCGCVWFTVECCGNGSVL